MGRTLYSQVRAIFKSVWRLAFDNGDTIEVTGSHPFFNVDRQAWIPVRDTRTGEPYRSLEGSTTLRSKVALSDRRDVYNLILADDVDHYLVGTSSIAAKTTCFVSEITKYIDEYRAGHVTHTSVGGIDDVLRRISDLDEQFPNESHRMALNPVV